MKLDTNLLKMNFLDAVSTNIRRNGIKDLIDYLSRSDFFKAPASTKFHMACEGGLVYHSLSVFDSLKNLCEMKNINTNYSMETIAIVSLFHDICKVNYYIEDSKNVKDPITGVWEKVPYYTIKDTFPFGHGEKSVFLVSKYIELTDYEALAIRWHMSGWDASSRGGDNSTCSAYEKYDLCSLLACADLISTYVNEVRE